MAHFNYNPLLFSHQLGSDEEQVYFSHITLRDLFAAAALQGTLSGSKLDGEPKLFAQQAYLMADAMLAARKKKSAE